jgi:hypothetical protein
VQIFKERTEDLFFKENCYSVYEDVKKEIKGYLYLAREEGNITLHHIYLHPPENAFEME